MRKENLQKSNARERVLLLFDKYLGLAERIISSLMLLGVVITVLVGIVFRFVLRLPNKYGEEISRYLLLGCIFIGISIGVREKAHLGIDSLVNALPEKVSKAIRFIADLLSLSVYVILAVLSFQFVILIKGFGQTSPAMTFLPMYVVYSALLIGFVLSVLRSCMMIWNDYFSINKVLSPKHQETDA